MEIARLPLRQLTAAREGDNARVRGVVDGSMTNQMGSEHAANGQAGQSRAGGLSFAEILAPITPERFFADYFGQKVLHVPGSWLPLVLIVGLFCIKYFAGASLALHPALASDSSFAGLCSLAYGSFSGLFLARALSLRSLAPRKTGLSVA